MNAYRSLFTTIFIAYCTIFTGARAENIYQCGNTYSQTPCAQGKVLHLDDTRDAAQKKQTDNATRRDAKLAKELQTTRLTQERAALASSVPVRTASKPASDATTAADREPPLNKITPKRLRSKSHQPTGFVALVPGSGEQAVKAKKKAPTPQ